MTAPAIGPDASQLPAAEPVAATTDPNASALALGAGDDHASQNDWYGAVAAYDAATRTDPTSVAAWYKLGVARAISGDMVGSLSALQRVKALDASFTGIDALIARVTPRAQAQLASALDPAATLGSEAERAAEFDRLASRGEWLLAIRTGATLAAESTSRGAALSARFEGRPDTAVLAAMQVVGSDPTTLESYAIAAEALRLAGDFEGARYFARVYVDLGGDPVTIAPLNAFLGRMARGQAR